MSLTKKQREVVRLMFGGHCAYCGVLLEGAKWHADHVKPIIRDGVWVRVDEPGRSHKFVHNGLCRNPHNDRPDNYFPACIPCNISKGAEDLEGWRGWLESRIVESLRHNSTLFKHAERFARITIISEPLVFYFEKYSAEARL